LSTGLTGPDQSKNIGFERVVMHIERGNEDEIQTLAIENGIPYQTLMASILHRYVHGGLIDKQRSNEQR
jgi:hypothetical protein